MSQSADTYLDFYQPKTESRTLPSVVLLFSPILLSLPHSSSEYIANASSSIMSSLKSHDSKAVWVVQGWMFAHDQSFWTNERAKAFLTGVPQVC